MASSWTLTTYRGSAFKLVSAKPEWARYLSLGRQVAFRSGKTTIVVVDEKGKEKLTDAEVKALEK